MYPLITTPDTLAECQAYCETLKGYVWTQGEELDRHRAYRSRTCDRCVHCVSDEYGIVREECNALHDRDGERLACADAGPCGLFERAEEP